MGDSIMVIVVIVLAAGIFFVGPLMTMADRTDDISQMVISEETEEFVQNVSKSGVLTLDDYSKFIERIESTGNRMDVEMEIQYLDETPGKKATQVVGTDIGNNARFSEFTSQIEEKLNSAKSIKLKEGDVFIVSVKNNSQTLKQMFDNFLYKVSGNDNYTLSAQSAAMVTVNGK